MRLPRFKVKFGFINAEGSICGNAENEVMSFKDVDFMLKAISPFKYEEWIAAINGCRRGGFVRIGTVERNEEGMMILKGYLFQRI